MAGLDIPTQSFAPPEQSFTGNLNTLDDAAAAEDLKDTIAAERAADPEVIAAEQAAAAEQQAKVDELIEDNRKANLKAQGRPDPQQIRNQKLPFMFEVNYSNERTQLDSFILPVAPDSYRLSHTTRATVTHTKGGAFEDNIGIGLPRISLSGTFGYLGTLTGGGGVHMFGEERDAWSLFKELEEQFLTFYEFHGQYGLAGQEITPLATAPQYRFYNFTDKDYWIVQINKFDIMRNTQRRHLYQYDIQMTCLQRITYDGVVPDPLPATRPMAAIANSAADKMSWVDKACAPFRKVSSVLTAVQSKIDFVKGCVETIQSAITTAATMGRNTVSAPYSLITESIRTIKSTIETLSTAPEVPFEISYNLRETQRDLYEMSVYQEKFVKDITAVTGIQLPAVPFMATEILSLPVPAGYDLEPSDPTTTLFGSEPNIRTSAVKEVSILDSDNLNTIAAKNSVSWQDIATLNGLDYPYISSNPADRVTEATATGGLTAVIAAGATNATLNITTAAGDLLLFRSENSSELVTVTLVEYGVTYFQPATENAYSMDTIATLHVAEKTVLQHGQKIAIPGTLPTQTAIKSGTNFYATLFGIDEELSPEGDTFSTTGDTPTVSGINNLVMQLEHRMMTVRGELTELGHPEYGSLLPTIVGKMNNQMWQERAILEARNCALADPRVSRLANEQIVVDNTIIYFTADVYPVNQSNPVPISVPLNA